MERAVVLSFVLAAACSAFSVPREDSACVAPRQSVACSNANLKYRTADGTCNNVAHSTWGASLTGFRRVLPPKYEDAVGVPVGWTKPVTSARLVSTSLLSTESVQPDPSLTHMAMQWGQFVTHDLSLSTPTLVRPSGNKSCANVGPYFPIEVSGKGKPAACIPFVRSSAVCNATGRTAAVPREQVNGITAFLDASQVYGSSEKQARRLRDPADVNNVVSTGRLREGEAYAAPGGKPLLPYAEPADVMECRSGPSDARVRCFLAGDARANEHVALMAMHTVWVREHNRVAGELRALNSHWDGERLYREARKIVGAEMQHITFHDWLPAVLGPGGVNKLGPYRGYDPKVDPSVSNAFATAALRFGHSLINPELRRLGAALDTAPQGHLPLEKAFFAPWRLVEEGGVDPLLRGLVHTPAKLSTPEQVITAVLTDKLFLSARPGGVSMDLAAVDVQRCRDHGLPGYNAFREHCGLRRAASFDDLRAEIGSAALRGKLSQLYGHPDTVDLFVGGLLEERVAGGKVGPTFLCLLVEQFKRLRGGDRFYYENRDVFRPELLAQIKKATLARVLCDNGDNLQDMVPDVFRLASARVSCKSPSIPRLDLSVMKEKKSGK